MCSTVAATIFVRTACLMLGRVFYQYAQQERLLSQAIIQSQESSKQRDEAVASFVASESCVRDLETALRNGQAAVEQEKELNAAAHDVREIMGAPKLHIVDVYDAEAGASASRSFGRVVYAEGKSLIFYAFDRDKVHGGRYRSRLGGSAKGSIRSQPSWESSMSVGPKTEFAGLLLVGACTGQQVKRVFGVVGHHKNGYANADNDIPRGLEHFSRVESVPGG